MHASTGIMFLSGLPVKTLRDNYEMRMITTGGLTVKSNVKIFLDEKEIKGDDGNKNDHLPSVWDCFAFPLRDVVEVPAFPLPREIYGERSGGSVQCCRRDCGEDRTSAK